MASSDEEVAVTRVPDVKERTPFTSVILSLNEDDAGVPLIAFIHLFASDDVHVHVSVFCSGSKSYTLLLRKKWRARESVSV